MQQKIIRNMALIIGHLSAPASMGGPTILGAAYQPWVDIRQDLKIHGWATPEKIEAAITNSLCINRGKLMTDHIKSSRVIGKFLESQGITIEVDEFAPVVVTCYAIPPQRYAITFRKNADEDGNYVCPYFGPGGLDNTMKALRAWIKKYSDSNFDLWLREKEALLWARRNSGYPVEALKSYSQPDGIALHDLLCKLMEETK